jgi:hypothetical protein
MAQHYPSEPNLTKLLAGKTVEKIDWSPRTTSVMDDNGHIWFERAQPSEIRSITFTDGTILNVRPNDPTRRGGARIVLATLARYIANRVSSDKPN